MTGGVREREGLALGRLPDALAPAGARTNAQAPWWRLVDTLLAVSILAGVIIAANLDGGPTPNGVREFLAIRLTMKNVLLLTGFGLAWPAVLSAAGLYSPARLRTGRDDWPRLLLASAIGSSLAMVFPLTSTSGAVRPEHALVFGAAVLLSTAALRGTARAVQRARQGTRQRQIVIVGSGPLAARMCEALQRNAEQGNHIVGFVDSEPHPALRNSGAVHLGVEADLERILMNRVVDDVVISLPIKSRYEAIHQSIAACERVGVPARYPADLFRHSLGTPLLDGGLTTPLLSFVVAPDDYRLLAKRLFDVVGAAVLLVVLAPVMLAVAAVITLTSAGPALFAHERYGYMKRRFLMYKFRTMVVGAEGLQSGLEQRNEATGPVFKIRNDPRLIMVGRFLRRASLDELPQLWNVLTGEMSLVGPRPMSVRDVGHFEEPWLMRRFSVLPGITCLWQTQGRNMLAFDDWVALDLEYIDRWSLLLDFKILLRTIPAVLSGRGAN
jgi:exopolysaccharide biosynthesis polyprenyl glycosylphosphotransferase